MTHSEMTIKLVGASCNMNKKMSSDDPMVKKMCWCKQQSFQYACFEAKYSSSTR
jgi:hypothetical protein